MLLILRLMMSPPLLWNWVMRRGRNLTGSAVKVRNSVPDSCSPDSLPNSLGEDFKNKNSCREKSFFLIQPIAVIQIWKKFHYFYFILKPSLSSSADISLYPNTMFLQGAGRGEWLNLMQETRDIPISPHWGLFHWLSIQSWVIWAHLSCNSQTKPPICQVISYRWLLSWTTICQLDTDDASSDPNIKHCSQLTHDLNWESFDNHLIL